MMDNIRNFSIIAHIDHGKSTLSDRLIQRCGGLSEREMHAQVLDTLESERQRGITIKAQSVRLFYQAQNGKTYQLNFIDTPGHVDFAYEVSRSLAACEGALLVVDAAQGVEAQTLAVCYVALEEDIEILPVLNKIDLPQAEPEQVLQEIEEIIGLDTSDAVLVSAKTGQGIDELLEQLVAKIPPPSGNPEGPLQALIIDSWFDNYLGVVSLVRVVNGSLKKGDKLQVMSIGAKYVADEIGVFTPKRTPTDRLQTGEVGYIAANIKEIGGAPVGDTFTSADHPAFQPLAGFKKVKPMVFAGLFPIDSEDFPALREALSKLSLNDSSLFYETESSEALGFGFRCGFLGLLHMEIVCERLEQEYELEVITTAPTVVYQVLTKKGELLEVENPSKLPEVTAIEEIREPIAQVHILVPQEYLGAVITLCIEKRGVQKRIEYMSKQVSLTYSMPMIEIVLDFFDRLKSLSRGYASLEYQFSHFEAADLVKLDILLNQEKVDALSSIVHRDKAIYQGREMVEKLQELIPRQMFEIPIQAAIGGHIIARTNVKALRKNVIAKCYGGDITRKRKLLEKQKAGKKRMKQVGRVQIPQEAFLSVLQKSED